MTTRLLVESILDDKGYKASQFLEERLVAILKDKLIEMKKMVGARYLNEEALDEMSVKHPEHKDLITKGFKLVSQSIVNGKMVHKYKHNTNGSEKELHEEDLEEANVQKQGRTKIIKIRIRNGKVQRRKKFSAVKGYTIRGGKLVRMTQQEKQHRKMGARRGKIKRRAKKSQIKRKLKLSLRRRKNMGIH